MAERLDTPKATRRSWVPRLTPDPDRVGRVAEAFARFMGTGRFLMYMTVFVIAWVTINVVGLWGLQWDPYPFILLNLLFLTQAAYAAPLILLAQTRQADRDRIQAEMDEQHRDAVAERYDHLIEENLKLTKRIVELTERDR